jgi:hypothetical protein
VTYATRLIQGWRQINAVSATLLDSGWLALPNKLDAPTPANSFAPCLSEFSQIPVQSF